jgi:UDP-N-acetylglucosamine transferase subunit ALG13
VIFVTVGTTLTFDPLVEAVDRLVVSGQIAERVVCQIGHGSYVPKRCDYFRFQPSLEEQIEQASLVIGHGGTGTVTGLLASGKPFIAVANPLGAGNHQAEFLQQLSKLVKFVWTTDLAELPALIDKARNFTPTAATGQRLTDDLRSYLQERCRSS